MEDNPINQELACDLLTRADIAVDVVVNGREALAALDRERYDAVLMDCQMPVMDGYEATRALRQRPALQDLPVIAMTANAMAGDREKVLAAGMNDHITKPIRVAEMYATLARWVRPAAAPAPPPPPPADEPDDEWGAVPGLDARAGVEALMGDRALYRRLLHMFCRRETDFEARFRQARASADSAAAARCAHDLKSLAGRLCRPALQPAASALEAACADGAGDAAIEALLQDVLSRLEPVLRGLRAGMPAYAG